MYINIYINMSNTCHTHQLQGAGLARRDPTGQTLIPSTDSMDATVFIRFPGKQN